jgi:hypothetical protein
MKFKLIDYTPIFKITSAVSIILLLCNYYFLDHYPVSKLFTWLLAVAIYLCLIISYKVFDKIPDRFRFIIEILGYLSFLYTFLVTFFINFVLFKVANFFWENDTNHDSTKYVLYAVLALIQLISTIAVFPKKS